MRLINPEELAFDLNAACNGYWIQDHAPDVHKWLMRKVPKYMQEHTPSAFSRVVIKKSMMSGIKSRLEIEGNPVKVFAQTDFDLKDAAAGTLWYYNASVYKNKTTDAFKVLNLSSLVEWLLWTRDNNPRLDMAKVTYEVALAKLATFEQEKLAAQELRRAKLERDREKMLAQIKSGEFHPIVLPIDDLHVFQVFHTKQEYEAEGLSQKNCMGWFMYPKFRRGHTLCGAIRKVVEPGVAYISIELGVQNFSIVQAELAENIDLDFNSEPVNTLSKFIEENRTLMQTIRKEVFEYAKVASSLEEGAPSGELRFTVRL